jgi:large subunit ribosomal protein L21
MKYAVIATGGKQYRVEEGRSYQVENLDKEIDQEIVFDQVLMFDDGNGLQIGTPHIENIKVKARIVAHGRGEKINIIKFKRRKHYMRRQGHRQGFTTIEILPLVAKGTEASQATKKAVEKKEG